MTPKRLHMSALYEDHQKDMRLRFESYNHYEFVFSAKSTAIKVVCGCGGDPGSIYNLSVVAESAMPNTLDALEEKYCWGSVIDLATGESYDWDRL